MPEPVGPGDQQDAVRLQQHGEEPLEDVVLEAEPGEVERDAALVEYPHDDRFAVHRRHGRDAQVDVLAVHAQPDAAVLRQPALGDVEVGHDLDPRDHRRREPARRRLDLVQHAVDPVADREPVLERLDVDVRRPRVERVGDDERDQPDHRRLGGEVLQLLDVGVEGELVALLDVADDLADRRAPGAVEALERRVELGRNRDQRLHVAAGHHPERADRVAVGRIGHRERELARVLLQRQRARLAQESRRDALFEDRELGVAGDVDQRQAQLRRERLGDVALRAQPERDEQRAELLAALLLQPQRALDAGGVELSAGNQDLAEAHGSEVSHAVRLQQKLCGR